VRRLAAERALPGDRCRTKGD